MNSVIGTVAINPAAAPSSSFLECGLSSVMLNFGFHGFSSGTLSWERIDGIESSWTAKLRGYYAKPSRPIPRFPCDWYGRERCECCRARDAREGGRRRTIQPINATSHWLHGEDAGKVRDIDARHTGTGLATHYGACVFWASLFETIRAAAPHAGPVRIVRDAAAVSIIAAIVDYGLVPRRLTPGWEEPLPNSLGCGRLCRACARACSRRPDEKGAALTCEHIVFSARIRSFREINVPAYDTAGRDHRGDLRCDPTLLARTSPPWRRTWKKEVAPPRRRPVQPSGWEPFTAKINFEG